jgi:hypothetical protein
MGQLHYTAESTSCDVSYKIKAAEGGAYELYEVEGLDTDYHLYVKPENAGRAVKYGSETFRIGTTESESLESISDKLKKVCFIAKGLGSESGAVVDAGVKSLDGTEVGEFNLSEATLIL